MTSSSLVYHLAKQNVGTFIILMYVLGMYVCTVCMYACTYVRIYEHGSF